jgi:hypothetical protein
MLYWKNFPLPFSAAEVFSYCKPKNKNIILKVKIKKKHLNKLKMNY